LKTVECVKEEYEGKGGDKRLDGGVPTEWRSSGSRDFNTRSLGDSDKGAKRGLMDRKIPTQFASFISPTGWGERGGTSFSKQKQLERKNLGGITLE